MGFHGGCHEGGLGFPSLPFHPLPFLLTKGLGLLLYRVQITPIATELAMVVEGEGGKGGSPKLLTIALTPIHAEAFPREFDFYRFQCDKLLCFARVRKAKLGNGV